MFGNMLEKLCVVVFGLWLITKMRLSTHKRSLESDVLVSDHRTHSRCSLL
jgi:hypothetical protein